MMMKNRKFILLSLLVLSFFAACEPDPEFDKTLLPGKWRQGTLYEVYQTDATGYTWDESDDVTEAEAQPFDWELDKDQLIQIHKMEMGGRIPKTYTVTSLSSTTLSYKDDYGTSYHFTRME